MKKIYEKIRLMLWAYLTDKIFGDDFLDDLPEAQVAISEKMLKIINQ